MEVCNVIVTFLLLYFSNAKPIPAMHTLSSSETHCRILGAIILCYLDHHPEEHDNCLQFLADMEALMMECKVMLGNLSGCISCQGN